MHRSPAPQSPRPPPLSWVERCLEPLTLTITATLGLTLLTEPQLGDSLSWDIPQVLGYLAFALLLYSFLDTGLGPRLKLHRFFGHAATMCIAAHVLWLLISEPAILYYLSIEGPGYMHAGLAALVLLGVLISTATTRGRQRLAQPPDAFRRSHQWLAIAVTLGSLWHVLGSGLYLSGLEKLLCAMATTLVLLASLRPQRLRPRADRRTLVPGVALCLAIVLLKWVAYE